MDKILHWTNHWDAIAARIAQRPGFLLATAFDGTLAPIARTPSEAILSIETRALLRRLSNCRGMHLAVISGRALRDVRMHVGIDRIFYAGNHGLELQGPGMELHHPQGTKAHAELEQAVDLLVERTASLAGVFVEHKGATAAVHWRLAPPATIEELRQIVREVAAPFSRLRLLTGRSVWELRPKEGWDKGEALRHLAIRLGSNPENVLYVGDDATDEDAFRAVQSGLTFRVGSPEEETCARFRMRDAADVQAFLLCVLGLRSGASQPAMVQCSSNR